VVGTVGHTELLVVILHSVETVGDASVGTASCAEVGSACHAWAGTASNTERGWYYWSYCGRYCG
jgi:hypothetical protein